MQRFITFLVFPYFSRYSNSEEFGVYAELLAYTGILNIVLTYGLETGFFKFSNEYDSNKVFSTSLISVLCTSTIFFSFFLLFKDSLAIATNYTNYVSYLFFVAIIIFLDSFLAIPFAKLRFQNRAIRFSVLKMINVLVMLVVMVFFITVCPYLIDNYGYTFLTKIYNPAFLVGYVFLAYIFASFVTLILLLPEIFSVKFIFDLPLWKKMMLFSLPIMVSQLAGFIPDSFDKIMLKHLDVSVNPLSQLGYYGANLKFASIVLIAITMFRYAAEPFFFSSSKNSDARKIYADIIKYVSIFGALIFLGISFNMPVLKYIVGANFREQLDVVNIVIFGYVIYALFYSLSVWYKVSDKTHLAIIFSGTGALVTIIGNYYFIPLFGYYGSAWLRVATYSIMVLLSLGFSYYYYKMPIQILRISLYFIIAVCLVYLGAFIKLDSIVIELIIKNLLIACFVAFIAWKEQLLTMLIKHK